MSTITLQLVISLHIQNSLIFTKGKYVWLTMVNEAHKEENNYYCIIITLPSNTLSMLSAIYIKYNIMYMNDTE